MTKTMKKVLMVLLVGILAVCTSVMGIFTGSADAASKAAFEGIIQDYITAGKTITDADLADAGVQVHLIQAKAYYDKMEREEREAVPAVIAEEWEAMQNVAGPALTVYSAMASLSIYLRATDAPRISVHKQAELDDAKLRYEALGAGSNSELFCDMRIAYDYTESYYATEGTHFFADLQKLINDAQAATDEAIAAINAIWEGIEVVGLDREDEIINAANKIEAVLPADRAEITNMADYDEAVSQLAAIKAEAQDLADDIDALYITLKDRTNFDGAEEYYTKLAEITALKARYDALEETSANAVQTYFQTAHATQYAELVEMLNYCETVASEIAAVIEAIDAIGTVTYTAECEQKIINAENLYAALDADVKNETYITNYTTLTEARAKYDDLKAKVDAVVALIDAITNPVVLTDACEAEIVAAETAYAALTEEEQANVPAEKYQALVDARTAYNTLEDIVKAWIARVEAFFGEGAIADIWAADLDEVKDLEDDYAAFDANSQAYIIADGADVELAAVKAQALANVAETQADIDALATTAPDAIVAALFAAKEKFDTLHATQQELINKAVLNEKWAKYQAVSYFDKAVAVIKANVDANLYFTQDAALMNSLFVLYNVLDEEARAMVQSYTDLVAIEAVLSDATLVNAYEYSKLLAEYIDNVQRELADISMSYLERMNELENKNTELRDTLAKANSTATIAMVIAILAVIAAVVGIVLATKKN